MSLDRVKMRIKAQMVQRDGGLKVKWCEHITSALANVVLANAGHKVDESPLDGSLAISWCQLTYLLILLNHCPMGNFFLKADSGGGSMVFLLFQLSSGILLHVSFLLTVLNINIPNKSLINSLWIYYITILLMVFFVTHMLSAFLSLIIKRKVDIVI